MGLQRIDFAVVARVALAQIESLLARWLPGGRIESGEYKVTNPTRKDRSAGDFLVVGKNYDDPIVQKRAMPYADGLLSEDSLPQLRPEVPCRLFPC